MLAFTAGGIFFVLSVPLKNRNFGAKQKLMMTDGKR